MNVRERFRPQPMGVNAAYVVRGVNVGGFLAVTAGTLTLTDIDGTVLVAAVPVIAGAWTILPFVFNTPQGGTVQLAGGASGTLGI